METCDENDQLLIMTGFGKNKVYTTFTYISPFILDTKTQPLPLQFCDCLCAYYKGNTRNVSKAKLLFAHNPVTITTTISCDTT